MLLSQSKRLEIYLKQPVNISIKGFHNEIHGIRGVIVGDCIPAGSTPIGKDVRTEAVYGLFDSSDPWDKRWKESQERLCVNDDNILMMRLCPDNEGVGGESDEFSG